MNAFITTVVNVVGVMYDLVWKIVHYKLIPPRLPCYETLSQGLKLRPINIEYFAQCVQLSDGIFSRVFTKPCLSFYTSQFGDKYLFNLGMGISGLNIVGRTIEIRWNRFKPVLETECSLEKLFELHTDLPVVKVTNLTLHFDGLPNEKDFDNPKTNDVLQRFGLLAKCLLQRPFWRSGNQLVCTVNGDVYTTTMLRNAFVDIVFQHMHIVRLNSAYSNLNTRMTSFVNTRDNFDAGDDELYLELAEAGFYLTNKPTVAQCFNCGGMIKLNTLNLDPWYEHAYWHYTCSYLRENKGRQFVDSIRLKIKEETELMDICNIQFKVSEIYPEKPRPIRRLSSASNVESADGEDSEDLDGDSVASYDSLDFNFDPSDYFTESDNDSFIGEDDEISEMDNL